MNTNTIIKLENIQIPKIEQEKCAWEDMLETFPGSGVKMGGLVCRCKKCVHRI